VYLTKSDTPPTISIKFIREDFSPTGYQLMKLNLPFIQT